MRSRTGCLTCRTRKLKCDEQKPVCAQCRKGGRECRPSEGIIFRHQQNASMNKDLDAASNANGRGNLKGFYSYKNTFDKDSVWLDIPKHVVFVDNSDPYAEDLETALGESEAAILAANTQNAAWDAAHISSAERDVHGLEALSAVAAHDRLSYPTLGVDHQSISTPDSVTPFNNISATIPGPRPNQITRTISSQTSPSISIHSDNGNNNNNINFLLNPSQSLSPPVDPSIQHSPDGGGSSLISKATDSKSDIPVETDPKISFLLRHFSEAPGLWMDLYDLGTYFASYVPVRALRNPLLKYAACAYAAKQLGHLKVSKPSVGGICLNQTFPGAWQGAKNIDWCWNGAKYYEKAIQLLMKELQPKRGHQPPTASETLGQGQSGEDIADLHLTGRHTESRLANGARSDEILAATAILSVYEFLDATGPAWNRHLSGVKSLLDLAEVGMRPLQPLLSPPSELSLQPPKRPGLSKARKATFWNFARQDYLAAFINGSRTRLNTEDLTLWTEAGLHIDNMGFVRASNTNAAGYPEGEGVMKEDMISNALVWILSKIVNFANSSDDVQLGHPANVNTGSLGVSQQTSLERWYRLEAELNIWYNGLPDTFHPCARIRRTQTTNQDSIEPVDTPALTEIWYSLHMCSSAMQHYHMARILLLINKPNGSSTRRGTVANRLSSYQSSEGDILFHSREIVGIAMACPAGSVRINSLQPVFLSGQCLTDTNERRMVLRLLRDIEAELGWATEYRVKQLLRQWGWDETTDSALGVS